jgi:cyclophilin family peptidyl-prolyl cis-trans isomerase
VNRFAVFLVFAAVCVAAEQRPNGLYAVFNTSQGSFTARLYEKETPGTVQNFVALAQGAKPTLDPKTGKMVQRRFYEGITFHRVVRGEMIQAGDPTGTGAHNCGVKIQDEILPGLRFDGPGKLAMANTGQPNSGGCQFFVTVNAMRPWDGNYTIFGTIVEGRDVITAINHTPVRGDRPIDPVKLISVTIQRVGPEPPAKKSKH